MKKLIIVFLFVLTACSAKQPETSNHRSRTEPLDLKSCLSRYVGMWRDRVDKETGYLYIYGYHGQLIAVRKGTIVELYAKGPSHGPTHIYKRYHEFKEEWPEDWATIVCYFSIREA